MKAFLLNSNASHDHLLVINDNQVEREVEMRATEWGLRSRLFLPRLLGLFFPCLLFLFVLCLAVYYHRSAYQH